MTVLKSAAAVVGLIVYLTGAAFAAEANPLLGAWLDKLPSGNSMLIEFTAERISFQGITPEGTMAPPSAFPATYRKDGADTFTVVIEGQPNDPLTVTVAGADKLTLQFPGRDPRDVTRYVPEAPAKPKGHP